MSKNAIRKLTEAQVKTANELGDWVSLALAEALAYHLSANLCRLLLNSFRTISNRAKAKLAVDLLRDHRNPYRMKKELIAELDTYARMRD